MPKMQGDRITVSLSVDGQRFSFQYDISDASGKIHPTDRFAPWFDERIKRALEPLVGAMTPTATLAIPVREQPRVARTTGI